MKTTIRFTIASVGMLAVASAIGCAKDNSEVKTASETDTTISASADSASARGHSLVRVVNAVNGGRVVTAMVGDSALFGEVTAGTVTDYREIANDLAQFSVRAVGSSDDVKPAQNTEMLMDGNRYTVFLVAEDVSRNSLRIVKDEVIPDSGMARIRVIHAAPGGPELDVGIVGSPESLFSGVNFKSEAGYKDINPVTATLEVRAKGEKKVLLTIPGVELKKGTSTTIVVTGASKLAYFKFSDTPMAPKP